jgi:hypothetical protein
MKRFPDVKACLIAGASLTALVGIAKADDHRFQATEFGGLSEDGQPFQTNQPGHSGDLASGQGSPSTGDEEHKTLATDTEAANLNANVKDREEK